jgi:hypothetical protein
MINSLPPSRIYIFLYHENTKVAGRLESFKAGKLIRGPDMER